MRQSRGQQGPSQSGAPVVGMDRQDVDLTEGDLLLKIYFEFKEMIELKKAGLNIYYNVHYEIGRASCRERV